tara:strand:- start:327 stop:608 length:282 start_codon:yes stop_codon:yes gene_type:complete
MVAAIIINHIAGGQMTIVVHHIIGMAIITMLMDIIMDTPGDIITGGGIIAGGGILVMEVIMIMLIIIKRGEIEALKDQMKVRMIQKIIIHYSE